MGKERSSILEELSEILNKLIKAKVHKDEVDDIHILLPRKQINGSELRL